MVMGGRVVQGLVDLLRNKRHLRKVLGLCYGRLLERGIIGKDYGTGKVLDILDSISGLDEIWS